ncbi:MAG: fumarylacetoacetate hydrolase family protein [Ferruginibacter sp.]
MKLIRFGNTGFEKPGIFLNGTCYDASGLIHDYDETFFENNMLAKIVEGFAENKLPVVTHQRFGCPVKRPSKIVCIGLNYKDHAQETGAAIPGEPVIFLKSTTAVTGPNDDVIIPKDSVKTDWEVELAVVIGKRASYVPEANAMDHVFGYCLHNDISERAFQLERGGTWDKGKGCDSFAPLGPFLVTKDEISDVHNLRIWLTVNGKSMQDGSTANMIFSVPKIVSYTSHFMTLLPGDIISTGTPAGVGLGMNPPLYLKPGDSMELGIDGLGTSMQHVKAYR